MPAYAAAVAAGAQCLEISVGMTADGVLVCMHDATYDRTTTGRGKIADQPSSVLGHIGIYQPQLGPFWTRAPLPSPPRLRAVLERFDRRVVYCLEAKSQAAYRPMMALVTQLGLQRSVIVKAHWTSAAVAEAKAAGYPVFAYLNPGEMSVEQIATVARGLDRASDYLVLPATTGNELIYYSPSLVRGAVAHGVPVWVYPIHRRADAAYFFDLGVQGVVSSSFMYTSTEAASAKAVSWGEKRVASGEMSRQPDRLSIAPQWTGTADLTLAVHDTQQFVTLGQLAPVAAARDTYRISLAASWTALPSDATTNLTLAFAHKDDSYYEHRLGRQGGYHALIRPDGTLQLYRHDPGNQAGLLLGSVMTAPPTAGQWMTFRLDVSPTTITWTRTDGAASARVTARDTRYRGGYLHIGRSAYDRVAVAAFRDVRVT